MLLRFFRLHIIVNGNTIYQLEKAQPVVIRLDTSPAQLVVTNGFHFTKPITVHGHPQTVQRLQVACAIEDDQLIGGFVLLLLFYAAGISSGALFIQIMSFAPIAVFLFLYYSKRHTFLHVKEVPA